jgi:DNA polymerase I-like protein with 3'-5' exonuclease and polymerase domains
MKTIDIETEAIVAGGPLLPVPVGISIDDEYISWGHPTGNTHTREQAAEIIKSIWDDELVTHNGCGFDVPVLQHHFDLPERPPLATHDTLFLAYLNNPNSRTLALKQLGESELGLAPEEQVDLNNWIVANIPECRTWNQAGAYISKAPAELVAKYAEGDTIRTTGLFKKYENVREDMPEAYRREQRLAPILAEMRNVGVPCDHERLGVDYIAAKDKMQQLETMIRDRLCRPQLNLDSNDEVIAALKDNGFTEFLKTAKGKDSASKDSLIKAVSGDENLFKMLHCRSTYKTLTGTFMGPWLTYCEENNGRIHAGYNQVRNPEGYGTRTGRLSSTAPNFQNVPNDLGEDYFGDNYPIMRSYLLPEQGHELTCGDFKNQEPRLAAHFEDGQLLREFQNNPSLDPYLFVAELCLIKRTPAKVVFLGLLYAMGAKSLAERLGVTEAEATHLRELIRRALPGLVQLDAACKHRFQIGGYITTLGGRRYHTEPMDVKGRRFDYKALNTLIQGSAADQTKEAMIYAYHKFRELDPSIRIVTSVHDEYAVSHPPEHKEEVYKIMRDSCNALPCDVQMLMDIKTGKSWHEAGKD